MSKIYVTTYEVVDQGLPIAANFYAEMDAARAEHWRYVESIGGNGFRPCHSGGIRSVFFSEVPTGWRKIGRSDDRIEAVPNLGTKSGKEAKRGLDSLPRVPTPGTLAGALGYSTKEMAIDPERGTIYFPTEMRVSFPSERTFVGLPRFSGDGFVPDENKLRPIAESSLMKAVEDHNAEAKQLREKADA